MKWIIVSFSLLGCNVGAAAASTVARDTCVQLGDEIQAAAEAGELERDSALHSVDCLSAVCAELQDAIDRSVTTEE
jgi:uncharacterized lipoprotein NlpE involved in copper resistance